MDRVLSLWTLARWLHLLAAITWIGGQLFILLVLLPIMRGALPRDERTILFARVARRYALVSWVALSVLVVTGVVNGQRRGVRWERLFVSGTYGEILGVKLVLVALVILITLVHALYFGRRITELAERSRELGADEGVATERRRLQILSGVVSGVNLLLNLVIVLLAAALVA